MLLAFVYYLKKKKKNSGEEKQEKRRGNCKHLWIPMWSPTMVLTWRHSG